MTYFMVGMVMFSSGWVGRSWVEYARHMRKIEEARYRHPNYTPPSHFKVVDDRG